MDSAFANVTSGVSGIGSLQSSGWVLTFIIGITILITLSFLSKNFRRFLYGLPLVGGLLIVYSISKSIGFSSAEGDFGSLKVLLWIIGGIFLSVITGKLSEKTSYYKKLESYFTEDKS